VIKLLSSPPRRLNFPMTANDLLRLINNQKAEHSPHAFRAGGAGMADFNRIYRHIHARPAGEIANWMPHIDAMRRTHGACVACVSKILAYSILITRQSLPRICNDYTRHYRALQSSQDRDYFAEIRASLDGKSDSSAALHHKRNWHTVALVFSLLEPWGGD
jgi:hypothetical protein